MSGRGKDRISEVRRLARRGGVTRIYGYIYEGADNDEREGWWYWRLMNTPEIPVSGYSDWGAGSSSPLGDNWPTCWLCANLRRDPLKPYYCRFCGV